MTERQSDRAHPTGGPAGRVLVVIGTRPEAIKLAPVVHALDKYEGELETRILLTGQHTDLVQEALDTFGVVPSWDLGIMREDQTLAEVGRACLGGMDRALREWPADLVLVQGDTASVFFGTLIAYFHRTFSGHVEAGLRSDDLMRPYPEEGFRRLTGVLADLHFAPTPRARENLLREGIAEERIHVTGNTVVDALLDVAGRDEPIQSPELDRLLQDGAPPFILLTAHRRESFGAPLDRVFQAVRDLLSHEEDLEILYPVHPNPRVAGPAREWLGDHDRVHLVAPLAYPDLVTALAGAVCVLTDSGGIQEEAPTFGTPVLVLRDVTERPEGVEAGVARLVGTDPVRIVSEARRLLARPPGERIRERRRLERANPYGDGKAGPRVAEQVASFLRSKREEGAPASGPLQRDPRR